jgi:hypothetical protein
VPLTIPLAGRAPGASLQLSVAWVVAGPRKPDPFVEAEARASQHGRSPGASASKAAAAAAAHATAEAPASAGPPGAAPAPVAPAHSAAAGVAVAARRDLPLPCPSERSTASLPNPRAPAISPFFLSHCAGPSGQACASAPTSPAPHHRPAWAREPAAAFRRVGSTGQMQPAAARRRVGSTGVVQEGDAFPATPRAAGPVSPGGACREDAAGAAAGAAAGEWHPADPGGSGRVSGSGAGTGDAAAAGPGAAPAAITSVSRPRRSAAAVLASAWRNLRPSKRRLDATAAHERAVPHLAGPGDSDPSAGEGTGQLQLLARVDSDGRLELAGPGDGAAPRGAAGGAGALRRDSSGSERDAAGPSRQQASSMGSMGGGDADSCASGQWLELPSEELPTLPTLQQPGRLGALQSPGGPARGAESVAPGGGGGAAVNPLVLLSRVANMQRRLEQQQRAAQDAEARLQELQLR